MLVKLTDHKGKAHHVNPLYVKAVIEKKPGVVEVHGSFSSMSTKITIKDRSIDELADQISLALATIGAAGAAVAEDQQTQHSANTAAMAATG